MTHTMTGINFNYTLRDRFNKIKLRLVNRVIFQKGHMTIGSSTSVFKGLVFSVTFKTKITND
jgi:hypothetical protein